MKVLGALLLTAACALSLLSVQEAHGAAAGVAGGQQPCLVRAVSGTTNQAGLVVTFGDGRTLTYCIEFTEDSITGIELLRRSGLSVVTANSGGLGAAVCSIDGEGCSDPGDCFCQCKGGTCAYWAYFQHREGGWQYSSVGAGNRTIRNGDADAWVWGGGNTAPGGASPDCAAPTATPNPTSTPRSPTATATAPPSATPAPAPGATASPNVPSPGAEALTLTTPPARPTEVPSPPSVAVGGGSTPPLPAVPMTPDGTVSKTPTMSSLPTVTATSRASVLRVDSQQSDRNLTAGPGDDAWSWRSTLVFVAFACVLVASGVGAAYWRRRGSSQ